MAATAEGVLKYNTNLQAEVQIQVGPTPHAKVHQAEWNKLMHGEPVEINPSVGSGFKVMSVPEWASRWKTNSDYPQCGGCASSNTKEHYFVQTWCRGRKRWESEALCLDCHSFTFRKYTDPDYKTPEEWEKDYWTAATAAAPRGGMAGVQHTHAAPA